MFLNAKLPSILLTVCSVGFMFSPTAEAQLAGSGTPGDRAVYTLAGGASIAGRPAANPNTEVGGSLVEPFTVAAGNPVADTADSFNVTATDGVVEMTAGHHLVIHGARYQNTTAARGAVDTSIKVNGAAVSYGGASSYVRDGNANNAFVRGGTILELAQGDTIEIEAQRVDNHVQNLNRLDADLQLIKLDDTLDYFRATGEDSASHMAANGEGPVVVTYAAAEELDTASFTHTAGSGAVTLVNAGHYLVFANTGYRATGGGAQRQAITQQLTLDGTIVEDSSTMVYLRHSVAGDGAGGLMDTGAGSIGMIVEASAGAVLQVESIRDNVNSSVVIEVESSRSGLTILALPSYGEYITLSGASQDVNAAQANPETTLDLSESSAVSNGSFDYPGTGNTVTAQKTDDYLFFASHYVGDFNPNNDRQQVRQGFVTTPGNNVAWGHGGSYHRGQLAGADRANDSGDWAGAILQLGANDTVATGVGRYGINPTNLFADSVGLQGLNISSISAAPLDPLVAVNEVLPILVNSSAPITALFLETVDANNTPDELTYTVLAAPTGGTLRLSGAAVSDGGTFTQEDIDNGDLTFDAGGTQGTAFGFEFEVLDTGGANEATGTFVIAIGIVTMLADDTGATDEDTLLTELDADESVLDNDVGTALAVTASDTTSANGAAVTVNPDGTFSYDPTGSVALQALDDGDSVDDTFSVTVIDFASVETVTTVTVTVAGLNDAPSVTGEDVMLTERSTASGNVLANDSDVDAFDTLSVPTLGGSSPGTFVTPKGATLTFADDGSYTYDPCTSPTLTGLAAGATDTDTFTYDVADGTVLVAGTLTFTIIGEYGASTDLEAVPANGTVNIEILTNDTAGGSAATAIADAAIDLNAALGANTDAAWNNVRTDGGSLVMEGPGTESVLVSAGLVNAPVGVTAAYDLSGTGSGALLADVDQDPPANGLTEYLYGSNFSTSSCTIEAVFRPDDQVGPEPIWGTGGNGTGSSLVLIDNQVIYTVCQGANVGQAVATIPSNAIAGGDYVHVVATLDIDTETSSIYVNGVLADQNIGVDIRNGNAIDITDWSGTDDEGIGRSAGTTGGDTATAPGLGGFGTIDIPDFNDVNDRFDGELAIVRVYNGALPAADVTNNYEAVFGEITSGLGVGDLADVAGTASPTFGTVVVLPSGATVTVESDGSLTYNPNGAFDDLGLGLSEVDTFTYTLNSGGHNATAIVKVTINGTNANPQIEIAAVGAGSTEGTDLSYSITSSLPLASPITVNLSYSGTATDGADYTSSASVNIGALGTPFALDLPTITDNLFDGDEDVTVTIDSVTGSAVLGATLSATSTILDADSAPEFTIAGPASVITEGGIAVFTVTASNAAVEDSVIDLLFMGSAGINDSYGFATATIVGGQSEAILNVRTFDDGLVEGAETIQVTLTAANQGMIGAASTASATITDGSADAVFFADFEGVTGADTPGGTLLNTDAPAAANAGTAIGSWDNILTASSGGAAPGLFGELDDARGDGLDTMFRQDRPADTADGEISAVFSSSLDITGANTATISFDIGQLRTLNTNDKDTFLIGLNSSGQKSFELLISSNNTAPAGRSLYHVGAGGAQTQLSAFNTFPNTQDFGNAGNSESAHTNLRIDLGSAGYTVTVDAPTLNLAAIDGVADYTSGTLAYAGTASSVSQLVFQIAGSADVNLNGGLLIDNVNAAGTLGQQSILEAWRSANFGSAANAGSGANDNDPNANGLPNLLEFALGNDPLGPSPRVDLLVDGAGNITQPGGPNIWIDPNDGSAHVRFTRRADIEDAELLLVPDTSIDLTTWIERVATVIGSGTGFDGVAIEAMQAPLPAGADEAQARLRLSAD